jgi:hypothetical protein
VKNILFLLLLNFAFLSNSFFEIKNQSNNELKLSFNLKNYEIEKQDLGDVIAIPGSGSRSLIGEPSLPSMSSFVKLDKNKSYDIQYNIISKKEIDNISIKPLQTFSDKIVDYQKNELIYTSNSTYPEKNLFISDRNSMRGTEFINLEIVPFIYNPTQNKLTIIEELEIIISENSQFNEPVSQDFPNSKVFERMVNAIVINPSNDELRNEDYQKPAILYICGGTTETNSYFQQLVKWRRKQGYIVYTANTSETGGSNTTAVKNYIQGSMNWDAPPEFVTLVGDDGGNYNIDSYTEYDSGYNGDGDHPFSQLDGNDLWPEVVLGRISVRSSGELATVVSKIIGYEQVVDDTDNWHEKAAIVGDPSTSGISCAITAENIGAVMEQYEVEDVRLKTSGGSYDSWMVDQLDEGVNFFNYRGYYGVSGFTNNDVDAANNGFKLPFATVITCGTGSFGSESQCLSEKFLRAGSSVSPKGAVACIGTATVGTHTMFNNAVNIGIYYGLFAQNLQTAGESLVAGKANLYQNYPSNPNNWVTIFTHWNNLMGDGATMLWTDTPVVMNVQHQNNIFQGDNYLTFNVTNPNGLPIEGALVTLMEDRSDFYLEGLTDSNGNLVIHLNDSEVNISENIELTVSKFNHKPYLYDIEFQEEIYVPYASVETSSFNDSNNNGIMNPGETIQLSVPIHYDGIEVFSTMTATLSSDSEINTVFDEVYYGNIENGTNNPDQAFIFSLSDFEKHNTSIELYLTLSNSLGDSFITNLNYNLESFELTVTGLSINDGDNNILDPGESASSFITLTNTGTLDSDSFECSVTTQSADLNILEQIITIPVIEMSGIGNSSSFDLALDDTAFNGETKIVNFSCQSNFGSFEFNSLENISVGSVTVVDPLGPDNYGYYIYDSGDTSYSLVPSYDWIDIEDVGTSLGDVNDDDGDNQDESQVINLPFTFQFYGEEYEQITVCSNGWISFGNSNMESFRNDYLPGPGGPSPMLAVFWDDLTADSGGSVYGYYDALLHVYIVQWNNVKTYEDNSNESFQAILFDPNFYGTPTGDGEILLQYEDFNNTSNGSYGGGTPQHGGYCSIGIEDHWGTTGLEYTFNNIYPRAARTLNDNSALFISTRKTGAVWNLAQAELNLSNSEINVEIVDNQILVEDITLTNIGEEESILSYTILTSPLSYSEGTDDFGNHWVDSDLSSDNNYNWIDISQSNQIQFENNDDGVFIDISSDFTFYGELYNQILVNPNGWVGFGDNNNAWNNDTIPNDDAPLNAIFAFWDDLNPENQNNSCSNEGQGNVYYEILNDKIVIWFNDVARCGSNPDYAGTFDFQIILYNNQKIDINYRLMEGYTSSATIGIQNDNGTDAIQVAYNNEYAHDQLTLTFKPTNDWLGPISDSNSLDFGEQITYNIDINGSLIEDENDMAYIIINSNSSDPISTIPITLSFIDNSVVGDINGDDIINVLDVVIIVNLIVNNTEYNENADLNDDTIVNVLDIVLLVNLILNS